MVVVKIGGSTLGSHDTTLEDLVALQKEGTKLVVVHGGGKLISEWQEKLGLASQFVQGLRVTDLDSLQVVAAVLAGLVNKELVAAIDALGGQAIGLSGVDGRLIEARVKSPELGYVGQITKINLDPLKAVLEAGYLPVIAPLGIRVDDKPGEACLLNVNADSAAGEIAAALEAELIFLTDVAGVYDGSGRLIPNLTPNEAKALTAEGVITEGMIPKVEACLRVAKAQIVDGRRPHALMETLAGKGTGTKIGESHD